MLKPLMITAAAAAVCGMMACAPARTQPEGVSNLLAIKGQLSESDAKIEQLAQRVALIQMMVDSHQRTLQDMGDARGDVKAAPPFPDDGEISPVRQVTPVIPEIEAVPVTPVAPPLVPDIQGAHSDLEPVPFEAPSEPQPLEAADFPSANETLIVPAPNPVYQAAMKIFKGGDYEAAALQFDTFAEQFPKDDLADNALYWSGECRYTQKQFPDAIKRFKQVVADYPSGSKVPDALLKIGFAYISMGDKESAITYLKQTAARYPFSSAGTKAEERLKTLQE